MLQAETLKEYLSDTVSDIFVSNLIRTKQTITPYAEKYKLKIIEDSRINEIDMGVMSKFPEKKVQEEYPVFWSEFTKKQTDYRYPEGENGNDVSLRIKDFINEYFQKNKEIVIVAHDGWIRIFICMVLGLDYFHRFKFKIANCGITTMNIDSSNVTGYIEKINDCSYLREKISYDK